LYGSVFRYRYANPEFDFNIPGGNAKASFDSNSFSTLIIGFGTYHGGMAKY
jgi:hypothetical protein